MLNKCLNCHKYIYEDGPPCCDNPKALHQPQPSIIGPGVPLADQRANGTPLETHRDFLTERGGAR